MNRNTDSPIPKPVRAEMVRRILTSAISAGDLPPRKFKKIVEPLLDWNTLLPDCADSLINALTNMETMPAEEFGRDRDDAFYMPTNIRDIEAAVEAVGVDSDDIFVDVGCGPGARLPVYVHLRTGAHAIGVEKYEPYYRHAAASVEALDLERVDIVKQDAVDYDYSHGTVFYFFRPFSAPKAVKAFNRFAEQAHPGAYVIAGGGSEEVLKEHPSFQLMTTCESLWVFTIARHS